MYLPFVVTFKVEGQINYLAILAENASDASVFASQQLVDAGYPQADIVDVLSQESVTEIVSLFNKARQALVDHQQN